MTYVTNRNASVILVPVAVYVGMGGADDLAGEPFLLKGGRRRSRGGEGGEVYSLTTCLLQVA